MPVDDKPVIPKEAGRKNKITEPKIESAEGEGCFHTEDTKVDNHQCISVETTLISPCNQDGLYGRIG